MEPTFKNISIEEYHANAALGKTDLVQFAKNPLRYKIYRQTIKPPSPVFNLGSAAHTAILEPDTYQNRIAIPPSEVLGKNGVKSTKAYKEWEAQQTGKTILTQTQADQVQAMAKSIFENPEHSTAKLLLTGGIAELSGFWTENHGYDIELKCRPDYLPAEGIAVDLKTCKDASPDGFGRDAARYKYHWSACLTLRGLTAITGIEHTEYIFVCIEKEPPHNVACYRCPPHLVDLAGRQIEEPLTLYAKCLKTNEWPGYENRILDLKFPGWAEKENNYGE